MTTEIQSNIFMAHPAASAKKSTKESSCWKIFFDGASRNNPGPAGAGVYITHEDKEYKKSFYLRKKTNNQAEYLALLLALFTVEKKFKQNPDKLLIFSDSELLVKQMNGLYRVKNPELQKIKLIIDQFLQDKVYKIKHVLRDKNKIADKLANQGIDSKKKVPESFVALLKKNNVTL